MCDCLKNKENLKVGGDSPTGESEKKGLLEEIKELTTIETVVKLDTANIAVTVAVCTLIVLTSIYVYRIIK